MTIKLILAALATAAALGCNHQTQPQRPTQQAIADIPDEQTAMERPGPAPTEMRPTNSPAPPDTNQNRTPQSRHN